MKIKKFSQKLVLNKETVASLENREMNSAMGGATEITFCIETMCLACPKTEDPVICGNYRTVEYITCPC